MTSKKRKDINWPVPLRARDNRLGVAVREYAQSTEGARAETAAYARVLARVGGRSRRVPMMAAGLAMTGVLTVAALFVLHRVAAVPTFQVTVASRSAVSDSAPPRRQPSIVVEKVPLAASARALPASTPSPASIRLKTPPASLPAGRVDLVEQAMAVLSPDAVASGRTQTGNTEIVLSKGSIELHVLPRPTGHGFAVNAGHYRFTVVGTAFTVSQTASHLELVVSEGTVAVWRGSKRLATVTAGGQWAVEVNPAASARIQSARAQAEISSSVARVEPLPPATPSLVVPRATPSLAAVAAAYPVPAATSALVPPPTTPAAVVAAPPARAATPMLVLAPATAPLVAVPGASPVPAPTPAAPLAVHRDCGQLAASKRAQEALTCYQDQAAQSGLAGETAQYELARLWRDSFSELDRALTAFQAQRSRFPSGALRTEADLSIIELLPRLDRHADALAESEKFLAAHPKAERRAEIHLLRGNIFREVSRDLDRAEREYALGAESSGRVGDDSRFLHAVCLEALGHVDEARKAYETYLLQTGATHAQEAKKRLERLQP
jgi:hypothetical protein